MLEDGNPDFSVVYRTIPTSNHNLQRFPIFFNSLYIVLFLHQTTTRMITVLLLPSCISYYSYIKPQLLAFCAMMAMSCISYYSYIKPQQNALRTSRAACCISYYSYIKPQLICFLYLCTFVVYRTIPTSNHNPVVSL